MRHDGASPLKFVRTAALKAIHIARRLTRAVPVSLGGVAMFRVEDLAWDERQAGSAGRIRTYDQPVNSRLLYH